MQPARQPHYSAPSAPTSPPTLTLRSSKPYAPTSEESPYLPLSISLHLLGWNTSNIARQIPEFSFAKTHLMVKQFTVNYDQLTFEEIFSLLPIKRLIQEDHVDQFIIDQSKRINLNPPKNKLSSYDVHMIKLLIMIGWKKKRIAKIFKVSAVLVSVYSKDLEPYTPAELADLFPSVFTPGAFLPTDNNELKSA